ncbi:hypothetical protein [Cupriavidus basilensis]|uniref:hypothetical protein n=1 Tax=Cupriavidus basilensis TaxID=68895 RepID=UPI0020A64348|nr:hypothetical protein [Cupriavidus basilensis]MCP3018256.1 hypothetical protein [Cupriavidus basilensis]
MTKPNQQEIARRQPQLPPAFEFPITNEIDRVTHELRDTLRGQISDETIEAIVQATRVVRGSIQRIKTEHVTIGGQLSLIDNALTDDLIMALGDNRGARNKAHTLFYVIAEKAFDLKKASARIYMSSYRKFLDETGALSTFNQGEMAILIRSDITLDEVDLLVEEKTKNPKMKRSEIRPFIERLRAKEIEIQDVQNKLELAANELADSTAEHSEKDFEIRRLREQITQLKGERQEAEAALSSSKNDLSRANSAFSRLQMAIDETEKENQRLKEAVAVSNAKGKQGAQPNTVEIIPPGYASLEDALTAMNDRMSAAKREMDNLLAERTRLEVEVRDAETRLASSRDVHNELTQLLTDFERLISSFSALQLTVQLENKKDMYRPMFEVLAGFANRLSNDLQAYISK